MGFPGQWKLPMDSWNFKVIAKWSLEDFKYYKGIKKIATGLQRNYQCCKVIAVGFWSDWNWKSIPENIRWLKSNYKIVAKGFEKIRRLQGVCNGITNWLQIPMGFLKLKSVAKLFQDYCNRTSKWLEWISKRMQITRELKQLLGDS